MRPDRSARRTADRRAQPILGLVALRDGDVPLYFYELHESDSDVFSDVLLAHDTEYDEAEFLELVLESRSRVIDGFREDTLIEAIAADLAERSGFLVIDDAQLRVAVNVSAAEDGTFVADVQVPSRSGQGAGEDFRTLLVDVEPDDAVWGDDRLD
jgi:hypothetical protein